MTTADEEIVTIVDRNDRVTGHLPRRTMRQQNLIHRASYILVFNQAGKIFIQRRTNSKDIYPGFWDIAAGGVVLAGESYRESAARELTEELGLKQASLTWHFNHYHEDNCSRVWGAVFTCTHNGPFILQAEEIDEGCFLNLQEVLALSERESFTPDGLEILNRFIKRANGSVE